MQRLQISISHTGLYTAMNSVMFNEDSIYFSNLHTATNICNHSTTIWEGGYRKSINFKSAGALTLDFDGNKSMEEMKDHFCNTKNVYIATSKSHQKPNKVNDDGSCVKIITPADYFHVYIGLSEPITDLDTYKTVMSNLINKYGADPACKDGARFFYGNPNQEHWYS